LRENSGPKKETETQPAYGKKRNHGIPKKHKSTRAANALELL
jgi:hypothetical protein